MNAALWSVLIQLTGSAASAFAAILVAAGMGLAAQGEFGLLRSWNDVLVMAAVFGLPQGLLHMQYREGVPAAALRRWIARYLRFISVLAACAITLSMLGLWLSPMPPLGQFAILAGALPFAAAHQLWRSLALKGAGVVPYAAVTAAPALLILGGLVVMLLAGWSSGFEWVLAIAFALCALLAHRLLCDGHGIDAEDRPWPAARLWSVSVHTGAQGLLTALLPAALLSLSGAMGASLVEIGIVSLGFQLYQVFGVAAAYVAPLLYDRVARSSKPLDGRRWLERLRQRHGLGWFVVAAVAGPLLPWFAMLVWPSARTFALPLSLMALAGEIALVVRVLWTLQQARGEYALLSGQALARLAFAAGLASVLLEQGLAATSAVPLCMLSIEALTLTSLLVRARAELCGGARTPVE